MDVVIRIRMASIQATGDVYEMLIRDILICFYNAFNVV